MRKFFALLAVCGLLAGCAAAGGIASGAASATPPAQAATPQPSAEPDAEPDAGPVLAAELAVEDCGMLPCAGHEISLQGMPIEPIRDEPSNDWQSFETMDDILIAFEYPYLYHQTVRTFWQSRQNQFGQSTMTILRRCLLDDTEEAFAPLPGFDGHWNQRDSLCFLGQGRMVRTLFLNPAAGPSGADGFNVVSFDCASGSWEILYTQPYGNIVSTICPLNDAEVAVFFYSTEDGHRTQRVVRCNVETKESKELYRGETYQKIDENNYTRAIQAMGAYGNQVYLLQQETTDGVRYSFLQILDADGNVVLDTELEAMRDTTTPHHYAISLSVFEDFLFTYSFHSGLEKVHSTILRKQGGDYIQMSVPDPQPDMLLTAAPVDGRYLYFSAVQWARPAFLVYDLQTDTARLFRFDQDEATDELWADTQGNLLLFQQDETGQNAHFYYFPRQEILGGA